MSVLETGPDTTASNTYGQVYMIVKDLAAGLMELGLEKVIGFR